MTLNIRHDWTIEEIQALLELPLMELLWQAQTVHREANPGYRVQLASCSVSKPVAAKRTAPTARSQSTTAVM